MSKKIFSFCIVLCMVFSIFTPSVLATPVEPNIFKDEITVRVGSTVNISFTYGDSATSAEMVVSNLKIEAVKSGTSISVKGLSEGVSYITLNFNDGSIDSIKINVVSKNGSVLKDNEVEIDKGDYENIYIDLDMYDASKATISYNSSIISVNKTTFTNSGTLKITGERKGDCTLKVRYNTGEVETYYIYVDTSSSNNYDYDLEIEIDEVENYYIDLDKYDASRATITYDSDYIDVNKTSFSSSGYLKITGENRGRSEIKIKYNTGDIDYIYVDVVNKSNSQKYYEEEFDIYVGEVDYYYIDLSAYGASKATITADSGVSINKTTFTSSGDLKITGNTRGSHDVKIRYSTGDIEYLNINVLKNTSKNPSVSVDNLDIEKGETELIYIYLGNTTKATLSVNNSNVTLSSSILYSDGSVKIIGKNVGSTNLKINFSNGDKIEIPITIKNSNYKEPTVNLEENKLYINEKTTLKIFTGSENSSYTITIDSPEAIKLGVNNYNKNTKTYTVNTIKNKEMSVDVTGVSLVNDAYITVKFPEGKSCKITLSVVESKIEKLDGVSKTGKNFELKENIHINKDVIDYGFISGYTNGTFGPLKSITREEFGVILSRIFDTSNVIESSDYFDDVVAGWSKDGIAKLSAMGVYTGAKYRPQDYITRYEVAEMLYNILDLNEYSVYCPLTDIDNSVIGKKIAKCYNAGIIAGYPDGTFGGNNTISRAEAVVMIDRIIYSNLETNKINRFSDVSSTFWAYQYILKAANT